MIYSPPIWYTRSPEPELTSVAPTYCSPKLRRWDEDEKCSVQFHYARQSEIIGDVNDSGPGLFYVPNKIKGWLESARESSASPSAQVFSPLLLWKHAIEIAEAAAP
ncbi:hypothetical protein TNCV_3424571 [Trichonephila clavipes]|nr:hypothetical protein TNCV_3424571 [Trichonephila clavipes]